MLAHELAHQSGLLITVRVLEAQEGDEDEENIVFVFVVVVVVAVVVVIAINELMIGEEVGKYEVEKEDEEAVTRKMTRCHHQGKISLLPRREGPTCMHDSNPYILDDLRADGET
jgi:hypothetical protein